MKTTTIGFLGLALFALSSFIFDKKITDKNENKSSYCLTITGKVLNTGNDLRKKIKVYLINDNVVIDSLKTNINTIFSFQLKENQQYSIKIIESDFACRLISISTRLPEKIKKHFLFHFDLVPFKPSSELSSNSDILDFPIALIYYNSQKGYFDYNRKYTEHIKNMYKEITFLASN